MSLSIGLKEKKMKAAALTTPKDFVIPCYKLKLALLEAILMLSSVTSTVDVLNQL